MQGVLPYGVLEIRCLVPDDHNGLVGGSSPPGPTTHSRATGDFLRSREWPRFSGIIWGLNLCKDAAELGGRFGAFVSGPKSRCPATETGAGRDRFE